MAIDNPQGKAEKLAYEIVEVFERKLKEKNIFIRNEDVSVEDQGDTRLVWTDYGDVRDEVLELLEEAGVEGVTEIP